MFFTFDNIKKTWNDKVSNGATAGDQALGFLEVLGKSVVAGTTEVVAAVVSELPGHVLKMADRNEEAIKERLGDQSLSHEERTDLEAKLQKVHEVQKDYPDKIIAGKAKVAEWRKKADGSENE